MDERGYCSIGGRLKEMIIRGGENIYPREIEAVLFGHPDVAEAAVVRIPDERWGEQVAAFVRPTDGRTPDPADLFSYCRARPPPLKRPCSGRSSMLSRSPTRARYRSSGCETSSQPA